MKKKQNILYVSDEAGNAHAVQISWQLWEIVRDQVTKAEQKLFPISKQDKPEPLADLETLKNYWDFKYPYSPEVSCKNCQAETSDWEHDPEHPFHLTNASLGGLLAFYCKKCGATVRKKHFKDHVALECTPPAKSDK